MFTKTHSFKVENARVNDFLRLVGTFGFRYDLSDELIEIDSLNPEIKHRYRYIRIYATNRRIQKLYEALALLMNYRF